MSLSTASVGAGNFGCFCVGSEHRHHVSRRVGLPTLFSRLPPSLATCFELSEGYTSRILQCRQGLVDTGSRSAVFSRGAVRQCSSKKASRGAGKSQSLLSFGVPWVLERGRLSEDSTRVRATDVLGNKRTAGPRLLVEHASGPVGRQWLPLSAPHFLKPEKDQGTVHRSLCPPHPDLE